MFYYFKKKGNTIEKYQVDYNEDELCKLADEIIDNCSYIKHKVVTWGPGWFGLDGPNKRYIRNYTHKVIDEYVDRDCETHYVLEYKYDEYTPPVLVGLIYGVRHKDFASVEKIFKYDLSNDLTVSESIDKTITEISKSLSDVSDNKKNKMLKKLEELLEDKKLNQNQKQLAPYYKRLLTIIKITLVDSRSIDDVNSILSFLELDINDEKRFDEERNSFVRILRGSKKS